MSQSGEIDVISAHPEIATEYITDNGTAVPDLNTLYVLGQNGVTTSGGGDTITIELDGSVADTYTGNTGTATPALGNINILGATVVAGTSPLVTAASGSTVTINAQRSQALVATDATKVGLCNFDSASFAVDANGFVTLAGGGLAIDSIHPDSGTDPVVPTAGGLVNIVGSGSTTTVGSLNTLTVQLTGLTNHAVLIGAGTTTITKVGPVASTGCILQSNGLASDPGFSTSTYPSVNAQGDLIYGSASNTLSLLNKDTNATRYLSNQGASNSPSWNQVNLADGVTGNLPVTNLNSGTSASATTFWRGDGTWGTPAGAGNVVGPGPSVTANTIATFNGTGGLIIQSSVPTIDSTGNLLISASVSGADLSQTVYNSNNASGTSNAYNAAISGGASGGDPYSSWTVAGVQGYSAGIDNSDSDAWKLTNSNAGPSNGSTIIRASTAGNVSLLTGDFAVNRSTAGGVPFVFVANTDNTNTASDAAFIAQVQGTSAGDPYLRLAIGSGATYSIGPDNSSSDSLKITDSSTPSAGNTLWNMTTAGEVTMPLQPSFLAINTTSDTSVTGDGTVYTMTFDSEVYDQNGDYDGTSTFTAPVTGRYRFGSTCTLTSVGAGHTTAIQQFVASNRTMRANSNSAAAIRTVGNVVSYTAMCDVDMDAADTITCSIQLTGSTKTVDVNGNSSPNTWFSGQLMC